MACLRAASLWKVLSLGLSTRYVAEDVNSIIKYVATPPLLICRCFFLNFISNDEGSNFASYSILRILITNSIASLVRNISNVVASDRKNGRYG